MFNRLCQVPEHRPNLAAFNQIFRVPGIPPLINVKRPYAAQIAPKHYFYKALPYRFPPARKML